LDKALWESVDTYFSDALLPSDPALEGALTDSTAADLPPINVSANFGKLLHLIARIQHAKTILEIGTLGGYSTIWLTRALPAEGHLISLEISPEHAQVARANLARAGLSDRAEVRIGRAVESLTTIAAEGHPPFDLVFIDADKPSNPVYVEWALKLTHPGSVIIVDNVVRNGAVTDPNSSDANVQGVRQLVDLLRDDPRLSATVLQTLNGKGYDGFLMAVVN
jgi:predicted O-methyltransferase YrrM